jgi:hypothetical protein
MISQLFGGRALLQSKLAILVFCITKTPVDRYRLSTLWNWIARLAGMEGISLEECRDRMVVYDPLRRHIIVLDAREFISRRQQSGLCIMNQRRSDSLGRLVKL